MALTACQSSNSPVTTKKPDSATAKIAVQEKPNAPASHLIGVWLDETLKTEQGEKIAYQMVRSGEKTYLQVISFTGTKLDVNDNPPLSPSAMELKRNGQKYISTERPNEIYTFDKSGAMLVYDETGLLMKCKRML